MKDIISMKQTKSGKHVLHWFRKGLRLHDNPALKDALKGAATFRCVYILDPWFAGIVHGREYWFYVYCHSICYLII